MYEKRAINSQVKRTIESKGGGEEEEGKITIAVEAAIEVIKTNDDEISRRIGLCHFV